MGTAIKQPLQDRVKLSFVIFDILALWRYRAEGLPPLVAGVNFPNFPINLHPILLLGKSFRGCVHACVVAKVVVGGACSRSVECLDEFSSCEAGTCTCQSQYYQDNNRCGLYT